MLYLGIDPGEHGAMVALLGDTVEIFKLEDAQRSDVWAWIKEQVAFSQDPFGNPTGGFAMLEKVGGYIGGGPKCPVCGQQRNRSPGSSMFNFGQGHGRLQGFLEASGLSHKEVTPQQWQKGVGISPRNHKGGETDTQWKNRLKDLAQRLFPRIKVTLPVADALLIAYYCRMVNNAKS